MEWTKENIPTFLTDRKQQIDASVEDWADIRVAIQTLYADKPVTMTNYRRKLDMLKKEILGAGSTPKARKVAPRPPVLHKEELLSGKTYCRTCGAALAPNSKAIMEHYEKKHYSEFIKNKSIMMAHPLAFIVNK